MEHFSSTINPPAVSMLATYSLESMMTGYFEHFEANENRFLDWAFAARHVMEFFYQLQRAAQQPTVGVVFAGRPHPLVFAEELQDP